MEQVLALIILVPTVMALILAAGYLVTMLVMFLTGGVAGAIAEFRRFRPALQRRGYHIPVPHH